MQLCAQCNTNNRDTAHHCAQCGHGLQHLLGTGTILQGRYQIERVLGTGGFGAVYLVRHLALGHLFALKTSFDTTQGAVRQFEREAKFLVTLQHPNLARVTDFFIEANGTPYLVMEYVEGENLDDVVMRTGQQPVSRVLSWMEQTLEALHYLHTRTPAIVHRDIKPGNLILQADGRLVLVDFGIAKESGTKTTDNARACTPGFSPPEQYGMQSTDARSDLYSVGATMLFLLTARVPPDAIDRMVHGASLILPGSLPPSITQLLTAALALNPSQRPSSAREFKVALRDPTVPAVPPMQPTLRATPVVQQGLNLRTVLFVVAGLVLVIFLLFKLVDGASAVLVAQVTSTPASMSTTAVPASPTPSALPPTIATILTVVLPPPSPSVLSPTAVRETPTLIIAPTVTPRTIAPSSTTDSVPPRPTSTPATVVPTATSTKSAASPSAIASSTTAPPSATAQDCSVHKDGRLWCNNAVPALIRSEPRNDAPSVNILRTKYSWFKCWTMGDQHEGGNSVWYYTVGDDNHNWGYVSAYGLATSVDPPPDFRSHRC